MSPGISRCGPRLRSGQCTCNRRFDSSHRAIAPVCRPLPDEFWKSTRNRSRWTATRIHCISHHARCFTAAKGLRSTCLTIDVQIAQRSQFMPNTSGLSGLDRGIVEYYDSHGGKSGSTESNFRRRLWRPRTHFEGEVRLWCGCLGLFFARTFERFLSCKQSFPFEIGSLPRVVARAAPCGEA